MGKSKKTVCMCVVALLSCLVVGATAFAENVSVGTKIVPYEDIPTEYKVLDYAATAETGLYMSWNTRPSSGQYGAKIKITDEKTKESIFQGFPYQVSVSPLKIPMAPIHLYTTTIKANSGTVSGKATRVISK